MARLRAGACRQLGHARHTCPSHDKYGKGAGPVFQDGPLANRRCVGGLRLLADDRTVDDEAARGERGALWGSIEAGDGALVGEVLHSAEVRLERRQLPLRQVHVPEGAVATLTRIPAQHVERIQPIQDGRVQALAIGVGRAGLAIGECCQARPS
jgi:hypothetical protein